MKKIIYLSLVLAVLILSIQSGFAQDKSVSEPSVKLKGFSLLDPSRLKMSQSYTFSFFSSGKQSGTFGLYTNTLEYRISKPLLVRVGLAYLHQPLSVFNRGSQSLNGVLLPNFQLFYQPSKNFQLRIDVSSMPGWYEYWYR
ncbi:MAG: hypothetical protein A2W07_00650 [candidate division Zixibacteria bacterium RBG_16_43_9]|nr:MAG: hypothetical protein A2W07_00650 [candidate division Zixibacteria bacterium RBG_16_43_9]